MLRWKRKISHNSYPLPSVSCQTSSALSENKSLRTAINLCDTCLQTSGPIMFHEWLNLPSLPFLEKSRWLSVLPSRDISRLLCNFFSRLRHWGAVHGIKVDLKCSTISTV